MPEVILHQWEISPSCGKVRKLLRHKGIAFSVRNYNGR
jgi:arsenate reductase-like glutaredoxin family protein